MADAKIFTAENFADLCAEALEVAQRLGSGEPKQLQLVGFALQYMIMTNYGADTLKIYKKKIGYNGNQDNAA